MEQSKRARCREKLSWIRPFIARRNVLYIGCVDDNEGNFLKHELAHKELQAHADALLGLYATTAQVGQLREAGFQAAQADFEEMDLERSFEVIVAADNIEHLSNCGLFLDRLERHLADDGCILVSTPNPIGFVRILELLLLGRSKANVEHTVWFTGQVLDQLARRSGLLVTEEVWIDEMHKYHQSGVSAREMGLGRRILTWLLVGANLLACWAFPQVSESLGFVLRRSDNAT